MFFWRNPPLSPPSQGEIEKWKSPLTGGKFSFFIETSPSPSSRVEWNLPTLSSSGLTRGSSYSTIEYLKKNDFPLLLGFRVGARNDIYCFPPRFPPTREWHNFPRTQNSIARDCHGFASQWRSFKRLLCSRSWVTILSSKPPKLSSRTWCGIQYRIMEYFLKKEFIYWLDSGSESGMTYIVLR